ncbi:MAG: CAP domain-containing protein [Thermoleophilia bacterium]|nr:CAP domain-containing protein [Thermoleophilia bacterium]
MHVSRKLPSARIVHLVTLAFVALALALIAPHEAHAAPRSTNAAEAAQLRTINRFRVAHHLPRLRLDAHLSKTAAWHARDMGVRNYFSHTDSVRRDPFQRMLAFGYPLVRARGENLAAGNASVPATFRQWLNSPPHRAVLMTPYYHAIGIARVYVPGSTYGWYWVTDFGSSYFSSPA